MLIDRRQGSVHPELVNVEPAAWAQGVNHAVYRWRDVSVLIR